MCRVPSLRFAVGVYLPLSSSQPDSSSGHDSLLSDWYIRASTADGR
jgi:hypothetical protein